jgi:hypothetical protein
MKECAWCGDDFRGKGFVLDGNYFCSEECMEDWRQDVHDGDEEETETETAPDSTSAGEG